jgi:hypothetical protein
MTLNEYKEFRGRENLGDPFEHTPEQVKLAFRAGETAYRRGLQQGLQLAVNLTRELFRDGAAVRMLEEAVAVAGVLRWSKQYHPNLMHKVHARVARRFTNKMAGGE